METDLRGLPLTTSSAEAAKLIDAAVTDYLDYGVGASGKLKAALDLDPSFAMAQCFRGYFMMMMEMRSVLPKVQQSVAELKSRFPTLTRREQLHVEALSAWAAGDILKACAAWEMIITDHPRDLLAMKLHHTIAFYTGRSQVMRSVLEGALGEWDDQAPGYGYVQGMYAYALEECGAYKEAEEWGRQAVSRNPDDLWAVHSVAHVLEMQARTKEGLAWLPYTPAEWKAKNPFKAHVWWHGALFAMAAGDFDRVLAIYDNELSSVNTGNYIDVSNQASLLKRLTLAGIDVGERWHKLAEYSRKRIDDHMLPFRDLHFGLALAADGDIEGARQHIGSMKAFANSKADWQTASTASVVVPLCEAMILCAQGQHGKATDILWPLRHDFATIGGSHAQRDLFAQILCDAAVRGGKLTTARSLLGERIRTRATRRDNWNAYAQVLAALGETSEAETARTTASHAADSGA
jgi:tetratricopeptide (TPR) repeat protein